LIKLAKEGRGLREKLHAKLKEVDIDPVWYYRLATVEEQKEIWGRYPMIFELDIALEKLLREYDRLTNAPLGYPGEEEDLEREAREEEGPVEI